MDTRQKIVSPDRLEALVASGDWTVIAGAFDPMTAEQAQRIAQKANARPKLAVIVETAARNYLLIPEARAILVAGLRCVDAVSIMEHSPAFLGEHPVERDEATERARTDAFIRFISDRQAGAPR